MALVGGLEKPFEGLGLVLGEALSIHFRSPEFDPPPGGDPDRFETYLILGAPERASVSDALDVFAGLPGKEAPRFVRTWDEFIRRTPPGRSLAAEEAGELVGLSAFTVRRFVRSRKLPASHGRGEGFGGGERPYRIDEGDLRWFMANRHVPRGRPKGGGSGGGRNEFLLFGA
jgi:hypothetical protein